jgi:hypothetical protein
VIDESTEADQGEESKPDISGKFDNGTIEVSMGLIYKARTTDWPNRLAWMVMMQLHKKYFPKDLVSKIELRRALNAVSLNQADDPPVLLEQISVIENKFNTVNYQIPERKLEEREVNLSEVLALQNSVSSDMENGNSPIGVMEEVPKESRGEVDRVFFPQSTGIVFVS